MKKQDELRDAVRKEFGVKNTSQRVEERLWDTYESLGEMPKVKRPAGRHILKGFGTVTAACAACFIFLVVLNSVNPALAESIPGIGGIIAKINFQEKAVLTGEHIAEHVEQVSIPDKTATAAEDGVKVEVKEVYCDGIHLRVGLRFTLTDTADKSCKVLTFDNCMPYVNGSNEIGGEFLNRMEESAPGVFETSYLLGIFGRQAQNDFSLGKSIPVKLVLEGLRGFKSYEDVGADPSLGKLLKQKAVLEFTAEIDSSANREWTGSVENENHITLEKIVATPGTTMAVVRLPVYFQNPHIGMRVESGALGNAGGANGAADESGFRTAAMTFSSLPDGEEEATVVVIDKNVDDAELARFTVNLATGEAVSSPDIAVRYEENKAAYRAPAFYSSEGRPTPEKPYELLGVFSDRNLVTWDFASVENGGGAVRSEIWDEAGNLVCSQLAGESSTGVSSGDMESGSQATRYSFSQSEKALTPGETITVKLIENETGKLLYKTTVTMGK